MMYVNVSAVNVGEMFMIYIYLSNIQYEFQLVKSNLIDGNSFAGSSISSIVLLFI